MHTLQRFTLRMPERWRGSVDDPKLLKWLCSIPDLLPPDPGSGAFRRSFALSDKEHKLFKDRARALRIDPSSLLRRLIALNLRSDETPASPTIAPRQARPEPISRSHHPPGGAYSESEGKKAFLRYIAELESIVKTGKPEAGEAQVRLARIREIRSRGLVPTET